MSISKNLGGSANYPGNRLKVFWKKNQKIIIIIFVSFSILMGVYGVLNLIKLAPEKNEKNEVVYETGDQPLPEKIFIVVNAPGGLRMRQEPNSLSKILKNIPDNTKLESEEFREGWYKVSYDGQQGWVSEAYVDKYSKDDQKKENNWLDFQNIKYDLRVSYPEDWVIKEYGANTAAALEEYIGFGPNLPEEIDPVILPPISIKITKDSKNTVEADYKKRTNSKSYTDRIGAMAGVKYVFNSSSGVQMTAYVVSVSGYTYILEESGGYATELSQMVKTFSVGQ